MDGERLAPGSRQLETGRAFRIRKSLVRGKVDNFVCIHSTFCLSWGGLPLVGGGASGLGLGWRGQGVWRRWVLYFFAVIAVVALFWHLSSVRFRLNLTMYLLKTGENFLTSHAFKEGWKLVFNYAVFLRPDARICRSAIEVQSAACSASEPSESLYKMNVFYYLCSPWLNSIRF